MEQRIPTSARRWQWIVVAVLSVCLPFAAASAQPAAKVADSYFNVDNIFDIEFAFDPQISPDGMRIVYTRQYSDRHTDARYSNLWVVDASGKNHRPLTGGKQHDRNARWSPDGKQVVFITDRDGLAQLYVLDVASGTTRKVTSLPRPASRPSWSPDGSAIAFISEVAVEPPKLVDLPKAPAGATWKTGARLFDRLNYRQEQLGYFSGYAQVFVVAADGLTAPRQLTEGPYDHGSVAAAEWADPAGLVWRADGQAILFAANRRSNADMEPFDTELYEVSVVSGALRPLTDRRGLDQSPVLSPDGRRLAYVGFDDHRMQYTTRRLYVGDAEARDAKPLTASLDSSVRAPVWAPDGQGLYFLYDWHGRSMLAYQGVDGARRDIASHVGPGYMNYGFGGSFSIARTGRIAYTVEDAHTVGALAVWDPQRGASRTIVRLNSGWLAGKTLGTVEEIWVRSSVDQQPVQGWILKPPDFDPKRKYPLILEIHGGPSTDIGGNRFDIEKQLYAAHGYVVLFMNPRGSTSYGEAFTNLIHHRFPGDEFFDLMAGVDAVIERGYIDERNLFVTGGSGGGVLTCWLVGRSDRFSAAVAQYGYVNATSQALTSDIPWIVNYWFPGPPWEHPEAYWKRSPLSLVGNVKTPTLMMVGLDEVRAPASESEQFYKALKIRGIDTMLVNFPEEPHGIRIYPSHHMEKVLTILAWFERYRR